jgi:hypothetical protein
MIESSIASNLLEIVRIPAVHWTMQGNIPACKQACPAAFSCTAFTTITNSAEVVVFLIGRLLFRSFFVIHRPEIFQYSLALEELVLL